MLKLVFNMMCNLVIGPGTYIFNYVSLLKVVYCSIYGWAIFVTIDGDLSCVQSFAALSNTAINSLLHTSLNTENK
jgi:hypothetical protein